MARDYGFIIYAMMPLAMTQNTLASIIRADGSPRYAMGAMFAGAIINIIGDPIAIFSLKLGIRGAAYATILGRPVSFLLCAPTCCAAGPSICVGTACASILRCCARSWPWARPAC